MKIRPAEIDDINGIQRVGNLSWHDTYQRLCSHEYILYGLKEWWSADYFERSIQSSTHILLVAEQQNEIIGVAESQYLDGATAFLWKLYVLKVHRKHGVGTALIGESIRRLPPETKHYCTAYIKGNEDAAIFYKSLKFEFDREEEFRYQDEVITSVSVRRNL